MAKKNEILVTFAASECDPWCKTGGLAEVIEALPHALKNYKKSKNRYLASCFIPYYRLCKQYIEQKGRQLINTEIKVHAQLGNQTYVGTILKVVPKNKKSDLDIYFVDCPELFDREGIYNDENYLPFYDNPVRYAFFCHAVLQAAHQVLGRAPDILHCHDWQTALLPVYKELYNTPIWAKTKTVFTIHNMAYQGIFPKETMTALGLPWWLFTFDYLEFHNHLNLMKGGIRFSDAVTTVSPNYATEVKTQHFGENLDGLMRRSTGKLVGILNGINRKRWTPETDKYLAHPFNSKSIELKAKNREELLKEFGLNANPNQPVFGVVSRFADQKGLDMIAEVAPELAKADCRLIVTGQGHPRLEHHFRYLAGRFPNHIGVRVGYKDSVAHRIIAGSDCFLMPSRYEPCGLTQMYSMRYGTVPVVHAVGGLKDTVVDLSILTAGNKKATGFVFETCDTPGLLWAIKRAIETYREEPKVWRQMMLTGMEKDFSWEASIEQYDQLYDVLVSRQQANQ